MIKFATKLAQVKGTGSAHSGVHHWWAQRLSAVLLVPLMLWFILSVAFLAPIAGYAQWAAWLATPRTTILMTLLVSSALYHGQLGAQVIIEDYIHKTSLRLVCLILNKVAALLGFITFVVSIVNILLAHHQTGSL